MSAIDVELLARALAKDFGPSYFPGLMDVTIIGTSPEDIAEKVAAEYDRLYLRRQQELRAEEKDRL